MVKGKTSRASSILGQTRASDRSCESRDHVLWYFGTRANLRNWLRAPSAVISVTVHPGYPVSRPPEFAESTSNAPMHATDYLQSVCTYGLVANDTRSGKTFRQTAKPRCLCKQENSQRNQTGVCSNRGATTFLPKQGQIPKLLISVRPK
jgi:hypothetical protein